MLTARTLATVLEGPRVVTRRWRAAVALHRARGNGHRRRAAVVVRQQAARAMYRARDARRHGLVYGYRSGTAALVCGLESVGGFAFALSLALLVSSRHFLVLLDSAVSVVHFAIAVVGRAARLAVVALVAVHVWICSCKEEEKKTKKKSADTLSSNQHRRVRLQFAAARGAACAGGDPNPVQLCFSTSRQRKLRRTCRAIASGKRG